MLQCHNSNVFDIFLMENKGFSLPKITQQHKNAVIEMINALSE